MNNLGALIALSLLSAGESSYRPEPWAGERQPARPPRPERSARKAKLAEQAERRRARSGNGGQDQ